MSADVMPMTCNTMVFITIGVDPLTGAVATDAKTDARLHNPN